MIFYAGAALLLSRAVRALVADSTFAVKSSRDTAALFVVSAISLAADVAERHHATAALKNHVLVT